jgi:peptidoglycan-associated lipoprotein
MRSVLMVPAALLILVASGCAKEPVTMPASMTPSAGGAGGSAASRPQASTSQPWASQSAAGATTRPAAGRTDSTTARPSPRDFTAAAALKDIGFDYDKYEIRPADAKILDATAAWLKTNARNLVLIEGHCDERGTNEYNLALGEQRAKAAMSYLVALGIQAGRISIVSYGEERPLCNEQGEACWAKNRRAHFLVKPE